MTAGVTSKRIKVSVLNVTFWHGEKSIVYTTEFVTGNASGAICVIEVQVVIQKLTEVDIILLINEGPVEAVSVVLAFICANLDTRNIIFTINH